MIAQGPTHTCGAFTHFGGPLPGSWPLFNTFITTHTHTHSYTYTQMAFCYKDVGLSNNTANPQRLSKHTEKHTTCQCIHTHMCVRTITSQTHTQICTNTNLLLCKFQTHNDKQNVTGFTEKSLSHD